jgi:hypothetical protein
MPNKRGAPGGGPGRRTTRIKKLDGGAVISTPLYYAQAKAGPVRPIRPPPSKMNPTLVPYMERCREREDSSLSVRRLTGKLTRYVQRIEDEARHMAKGIVRRRRERRESGHVR